MSESIVKSLMLIRTLEARLEQLRALLGDDWHDFRARLRTVLDNMARAQGELIPLHVGQLIDIGLDYPAAAKLVRELIRQVNTEVEDSQSTVRLRLTDPTTGRPREVNISRGARETETGTAASEATAADAFAAANELNKALEEMDVSVTAKGVSATKSAPEKTASRAFNAFPRLEAPDQVAPEEEFTVLVGFRADLDHRLENVMPIHIDNPLEDAKLLVMLIVDGVTVPDGYHRHLPLDMAAEVEFHCQAKSNIEEARLTVDYIYDSQIVGTATRTLQVGGTKKALTESADEENEIPPLSSPSSADYVDLTVSIYKMKDGNLQWSFNALQPEINSDPIALEKRLTEEEARRFPGSLIKQLREVQYTGILAANTLENLGQDIADIMPKAFFDVLRQVHGAIGRLPTVLLLTEETFVPWELAILEEPLEPNLPPYLATQSYIARWYRHEKVSVPPPVTLEANLFSVIASPYGRGSGQRELTEALKEQAELKEQLQGYGIETKPYEATFEALENLITGDKTPGHLVHFAVHGTSGPDAADNMLLLADRKRLPAGALVGRYQTGETPTFAFVFLNACQVGQAGTSLGQAAGFPGKLIRGGALGFIAPLWEVHDEPARRLAEAFYQSAFKEGRSVATFLQGQRARYDRQGTATPMAYIFYGHPRLCLNAVSKEANHG